MNWDDIKYFLYIAKAGSLSKASKALKVNHSTVSRRLKALEQTLNTRLFEKNIHGITLTEAGKTLLGEALKIEQHLETTQRKLHKPNDVLCGVIRLSTEDTFGYYLLPPILAKFQKSHPHVVIDLNITSNFVNLSHREADVAITARKKPPEHLFGRRINDIRMVLAATRTYLKKNGSPKTINAIKEHPILCPNETLSHLRTTRWVQKNIPRERIIFKADKFSVLMLMAKQHLGLSLLPHYLVKDDRQLQTVLTLPESCQSGVWILTHPDLKDSRLVRTFMTFVGKNLTI